MIALLGMPGSGKTEAIEYIREKYDWPKVYFGQVTFDELKRRGMEINPANERLVREDLRDRFGEDHYAKEVVKKIEALQDAPVVLVESLYSLNEYQVLKDMFGSALVTISIHAAPEVRYKRLATRPERPLTQEEASVRDIAQLKRLSEGGPIALANFVVVNEGSVDELHQHLDDIIQSLI